jgi:hypothetical protein
MSNYPYAIAALVFGAASLVLVARVPLTRWYRKVRRRKGGVYLWRVDHHRNRARRVNGYVGETVSYYFRSRQHMGSSHYNPVTGKRGLTPARVPAQPWSDLNPKMYKILPLPWWLCWKWVLRPLETLVMLCTWPVYNDAKNHWNPRRITKTTARVHRAQRDAGAIRYTMRVWTAHLFRAALLTVLALTAGGGALLWLMYR